jgi:hypothetical protein
MKGSVATLLLFVDVGVGRGGGVCVMRGACAGFLDERGEGSDDEEERRCPVFFFFSAHCIQQHLAK